MIKRNSESFRVIQHLLNDGALTAVDACKRDISNNLRSRITDLKQLGFDIIATQTPGKTFCVYDIPQQKREINRELFRKHING